MKAWDALYLRSIDVLRTAAQEGESPPAVQARIRELAKEHPTAKMDVFWEVDPYSKKHHYDLLVRTAGAPSVLLSASPDGGVPWVYRGAFRWNETVLLRVNNQRVLMHDALMRCDVLWGQSSIAERLVNGALVADYMEKRGDDPYEIDDAELQATVDAVRFKLGLFTEKATRAWMDARGITAQGLEQIAREAAVGVRVRQQVVDGRETKYFEEHFDELARALILEVRGSEREQAEALYRQAREAPGGLLDCVARHACACLLRGQESSAQPTFRTLWRAPCEPHFEPVFAADAPNLLPPIQYANVFAVVQVLERRPPVLDESTKIEVQNRLFKQWLVDRRREARIEWSWDLVSTPA